MKIITFKPIMLRIQFSNHDEYQANSVGKDEVKEKYFP